MGLLPLLETIAARGAGAAASVAAVETTLRRNQMTPLHVHDEDEAVHVTAGEVTLYVGEEIVRLGPGDSYIAPRDIPHTMRADAARVKLYCLTFARSAARFEEFIRAVGPVGPMGEAASALEVIAAANGILVLGAPGALPAAALPATPIVRAA